MWVLDLQPHNLQKVGASREHFVLVAMGVAGYYLVVPLPETEQNLPTCASPSKAEAGAVL